MTKLTGNIPASQYITVKNRKCDRLKIKNLQESFDFQSVTLNIAV